MFRWIKHWFGNRKESVIYEAAIIVADCNNEISSTFPAGTVQSISWNAIDSIEVHTNDSGPWGADVWWILKGNDSFCSYPQGATGEVELIPTFQSLPNFN
ncbi:MAG: hypothetical protein ACI9DS_002997 [Glaciecola sp.]|jgi:hypothetical protein